MGVDRGEYTLMAVLTRVQSKKLYQSIIDKTRFFDNLTEEQQDVLTYLADGMTIREIAIGSNTTKNHISHVRNQVFRRLGFKINEGTYFDHIYNSIVKN